RLPPLLCVAALAAATTALSACGSDELSVDDFTKQADKVCRDNQEEFSSIQGTPPKTADQAEAQAEALIEVADQALDELRSLSPPEDIAATYDRYLEARERALGYLEDGRDAAAANDPKAYAAAKRKAAAGQAARLALARDVGLRDCSRPSVSLGGDQAASPG
ncbi:MAG: hypothetical protein AABM29_10965, partial [Actinomycetota bacterium]